MLVLLFAPSGWGDDAGASGGQESPPPRTEEKELQRCIAGSRLRASARRITFRDHRARRVRDVPDSYEAFRIPLDGAIAGVFYVFETSEAAQRAVPPVRRHAARTGSEGGGYVRLGRNVVVRYIELPTHDEGTIIGRCLRWGRSTGPPP